MIFIAFQKKEVCVNIYIYLFMIAVVIYNIIFSRLLKKDKIKQDNCFLFMSFFLLFIISAFRAETVGTDTSNYLRGFELIKNSNFTSLFDSVSWEKGYVLLNKMVSFLIPQEQGIIVVSSFIILLGLFISIKKNSTNIISSILLYINLYYYFISFNMIRQSIALSLIVVSYTYIKERNFKMFFFLVLLSSTFHLIALVFIPIYFLYNIRLNSKNMILLLGAFVFLYFGFDFLFKIGLFFFPKYTVYFGTNYFEGSGVLTTLISLCMVALGIILKITQKSDKEFDFLFILMLIGLLLSLFSQNMSLFNRMAYYFTIFSIFFIPKGLNMIKSKLIRIIFYFPILTITFAYFFIRLLEGWQRVTPYVFFFN